MPLVQFQHGPYAGQVRQVALDVACRLLACGHAVACDEVGEPIRATVATEPAVAPPPTAKPRRAKPHAR